MPIKKSRVRTLLSSKKVLPNPIFSRSCPKELKLLIDWWKLHENPNWPVNLSVTTTSQTLFILLLISINPLFSYYLIYERYECLAFSCKFKRENQFCVLCSEQWHWNFNVYGSKTGVKSSLLSPLSNSSLQCEKSMSFSKITLVHRVILLCSCKGNFEISSSLWITWSLDSLSQWTGNSKSQVVMVTEMLCGESNTVIPIKMYCSAIKELVLAAIKPNVAKLN